jgi:hypothetical protein
VESGTIIPTGRGNAVYIDDAHLKDDTVGKNANLSYNYPDKPDSGW